VGSVVGLLVGEGVGPSVDVGAEVGLAVGLFVGAEVGLAVGLFVGAEDGLAVGLFVGVEVGLAVGLFVGAEVGVVVSATSAKPIVGFWLGVCVGAFVIDMPSSFEIILQNSRLFQKSLTGSFLSTKSFLFVRRCCLPVRKRLTGAASSA
jgi:hypothetical protein